MMHELALFAGAGGGILGGQILGWRTVCAIEIDPYAASVLVQRQNDGLLPTFPIWDDVRSFDGKPWRGIVDVVSGGFPCQDISTAGRGAGIKGERSGLWAEFARIIREIRPRFAFVENSPVLTARGLGTILGDLAAMGYDARWCVLGANAVGAPHIRKRLWILANSNGQRKSQSQRREQKQRRRTGNGSQDLADADQQPRGKGRQDHSEKKPRGRNTDRGHQRQDIPDSDGNGLQRTEHTESVETATEITRRLADAHWWAVEPEVGRMANGVAARMDRLKALGNGQVPLCAATAFEILSTMDSKQ